MSATAEAIFRGTRRTLLPRIRRHAQLSSRRSNLRGTINLREDLRVSRAVIITLAEAGHTEVGKGPKQEKGRYPLAPKRTVPPAVHLKRYDTVTATHSQNYRRPRTVPVA